MNALILQGSPREGGNTEVLANHVAKTMTQGGASVRTIRLADLELHGCRECFACQKVQDHPGCPTKDDMPAVYDAVRDTDLIILATPVFCWGMTAQLKAAIDRFYAFCKFGVAPDGGVHSLIAGKQSALLVTAGGGPYDGAELCVSAYRRIAEFMQLKDRGELVEAPAGETGPARNALLARAANFATGLVQ